MTNSAPRPDAATAAPGRCTSTRRKTYAALLATALAVPLVATAATAAVTPIAFPRGITLFPERDFLGVEGFPEAPVTINVYRGDVKIGTATGTPLPNADTGTLLEVNHPGGICWGGGSTPDLLPGDRVEVLTEDTGDAATTVGEFASVLNVTAKPAKIMSLDGDGRRDDLVIEGTAADPSGNRIAPALESQVEQRIVAPDLKETSVGRRDIRALFTGGVADGVATTGDIAWNDTAAGSTDPNWTATYRDLPLDVIAIAEAGQTRVLSWERTDVAANRIGMTIYEAGELGGPGFGGCPPLASNAVTGTTPASVNIASAAAGGNVVINGTSFGATTVAVEIDDHDTDATDVITATATPNNLPSTDPAQPIGARAQTWRATVPMARLAAAGMNPGELTVTGTFTQVTPEVAERQDPVIGDHDANPATPDQQLTWDDDQNPLTPEVPLFKTVQYRVTKQLGGAQHTLLKDLVAPALPLVSPVGGQYFGAQSVNAFAADQAQETVRYSIGDPAVAVPNPSSPAASGQIEVTSTQTLKTRSFDRAGNPGPVRTDTYTISQAGVPLPPTTVTGVAQNGQVGLRWTSGTANGSPVTGYVLRAYTENPETAAEAPFAVAAAEVTGGTTLSGVVTGLQNGVDHWFTVSAVSAIGEGAPSPVSGAVRPVAPARVPFAPTISLPTRVSGTQARVAWTPGENGGSPITGYRVTAINTATGVRSAPQSATASPATLTLPSGQTYQFEVAAVNAIGVGTPSELSDALVLSAPASAPAIGTAVAGDAAATIDWSEPTNTGGVPVNSYLVEVRSGTTVVGTLTHTDTLDTLATVSAATGVALRNGTPYQFRVRAVTAAGNGAFSALSNIVTPADPDPSPTVTGQSPASGATGIAVASNVTATFSEPVTGVDGGAMTLRAGTAATGTLVPAAVSYNATTRTATLDPTGTLAAGAVYTARLTTSIVDAGGQALTTAPVSWSFTTAAATTPTTTTPTAPTAITATRGAASATVGWAAPSNAATSNITGYRVRYYAGTSTTPVTFATTAAATARSLNVTGLTNGTSYTFDVTALSGTTTGAVSARSAAVVPAATTTTVPATPVIGTAVAGVAGGTITATANWTPPANTAGITGYRVSAIRVLTAGGAAQGAATLSAVLPTTARTLQMTLAAGNYQFQVRAVNGTTLGALSTRSNMVVAR